MEAITTKHNDLVKKSIDGDQHAQAALYQHYAKAMFNVCMRFMRNREDAEDALQESFVTAFLRLHTFRFEASFGSWLKRIVINHCINTLKKARLDLHFLEDMGALHLTDETNDNAEEAIKFSVQQVKLAMKNLPNGSKMVFNLYLFEGYDHKEIAEIMNITETTSKTQYMRAKRKIVAWLTPNTGDDGEQ